MSHPLSAVALAFNLVGVVLRFAASRSQLTIECPGSTDSQTVTTAFPQLLYRVAHKDQRTSAIDPGAGVVALKTFSYPGSLARRKSSVQEEQLAIARQTDFHARRGVTPDVDSDDDPHIKDVLTAHTAPIKHLALDAASGTCNGSDHDIRWQRLAGVDDRPGCTTGRTSFAAFTGSRHSSPESRQWIARTRRTADTAVSIDFDASVFLRNNICPAVAIGGMGVLEIDTPAPLHQYVTSGIGSKGMC